MGWLGPWANEVEHEGWAVPVFIDGAEGAGSSGSRGVSVARTDGQEEWRADADVIGWRAGCDCGCAGPLWIRALDPARADPAARRVYGGRLEDYVQLDEASEGVVMGEWREHIAPWKRLETVSEAAEAHAQARSNLDEAVQTARTAEASWADIA